MIPAGAHVHLFTSDGGLREADHVVLTPLLFDERSVLVRPVEGHTAWLLLVTKELLLEVEDEALQKSGAVLDLTSSFS
jgi:hypothetical protein